MNEKRIIDRDLLASFIEYATKQKVAPAEWNRFAINHYSDPVMETARVECVRLLSGYGSAPPRCKDTKHALFKIAKELREIT